MTLSRNNVKLGFIGAGNMTAAIVHGLCDEGFNPQHLWLMDRHPEKLQQLESYLGVNTTADAIHCAKHVDILFLAIKPQSLNALKQQVPLLCQMPTLIVSVMAGVTVEQLALMWQIPESRIIRAMPNTPALVQQGVVGLFANPECRVANQALMTSLFDAIGICGWFENDDEINKITALSGSGPGYVLYILEQYYQWLTSRSPMSESEFITRCLLSGSDSNQVINAIIAGVEAAAENLDLPGFRPQMASQIVIGTLGLCTATSQHMTELCNRVTSKGGTTAAAIASIAITDWSICFESKPLRVEEHIITAAQAAYARANQLTV